MNWKRAMSEIAYVAGECVAVRKAGFTEAALWFPRSHDGLVALCAFNGIKPEQAPRGWHYWPNAATKNAWERVIAAIAAAARQGGDAQQAPCEASQSGGVAVSRTRSMSRLLTPEQAVAE